MSRLSTAKLLAAERAVDLGAELIRRGRAHYGAMIPKGDRDYATAVDLEVERAIREALSSADPGIAFLGEEEGLSPTDADALWVLDPIDGTVNFSKASPLCGISLALLEAGRPTLGIVDLPLLGERHLAEARREQPANSRPRLRQPRSGVARSRSPERLVDAVQPALGRQRRGVAGP